ncbi:AI-2E family transporter [Thermomonas sp.]|uniref:AI-2E family transporter n=1 Tax=Thermomonas sp. TaxID=1971895 RepID=UPI002598AA7E|nr:AI-2E family transporter [Thermomonas sp.]MBS0459511.1 AI-2E family transporter [Pseudomonadota bacterium]HOC10664.1 AI-2E family transporter [Thermomonas sp.]HQA01435.1 AI-2E family transporter [Thermomonas sp.]HQE06654.1 AI-2E family transporter [Thermomonas sp.]
MHRDEDLATIATFYRRVQWSALTVGVLWVVWLLAPILSPFVIAAILGWLGDPMVDRLEARRISRNTAVILVFGAMTVVLLVVAVLLIPVLEDQVMTLINSLPGYRDWFVGTALPWVEHRTGLQILSWLDPERLFVLIREHWQSAGGAASTLLGYVSRSGFALLGWLANIVLLPVLSFFFLRDWDLIVGRIGLLVPRDHFDTVRRLALESNEVLGGFLRGQMLVMLILGLLYALGLWLVGLDLGILIGLLAGLLTFVPYLGPAFIVLFGGIAALVQFGDWQHLAGVGVVFAVGQLVESFVLTPMLVGDRIGLHPMAVIFAVMAGGTLFGFLGMLLALPVAAVVNVLLRYTQERYRQSRLYAGDTPVILLDAGLSEASIESNHDASEA